MNKKPHVIAFSYTQKTGIFLNRLQRQTGKNRSQIIRDLISESANQDTSTAKNAIPNAFALPQQEQIIKSFFEIVASPNILVLVQAVIARGDRVLAVLPKKTGQIFKYSTWEFPSYISSSFDIQEGLVAKIKKELGAKVKIDQLILGRLSPETSVSGQQVINILCHCHIISGKIIPVSSVKETKWIPATQLGRYFTTSLGDPFLKWLSQLK